MRVMLKLYIILCQEVKAFFKINECKIFKALWQQQRLTEEVHLRHWK